MNNSDRLLLRIRARHLCEYYLCPENCNPDMFPADHVITKAKGGVFFTKLAIILLKLTKTA